MKEHAIVFGREATSVGIVTEPAAKHTSPSLPAVVILNSGVIHRVGPNRIYVALARDLAALGFPVLRFDLSGIGGQLCSQPHALLHRHCR